VTEAAWQYQAFLVRVTDQDRLISPTLQREIAAGSTASVFVLRAGHAAFLSKPKETADVILAACGSAQQGLSGESIAAALDRG